MKVDHQRQMIGSLSSQPRVYDVGGMDFHFAATEGLIERPDRKPSGKATNAAWQLYLKSLINVSGNSVTPILIFAGNLKMVQA